MFRRLTNKLRLTASVLRYGRLPSQGLREVPAINLEEVAEAREFFPSKNFLFLATPVPVRLC